MKDGTKQYCVDVAKMRRDENNIELISVLLSMVGQHT